MIVPLLELQEAEKVCDENRQEVLEVLLYIQKKDLSCQTQCCQDCLRFRSLICPKNLL